MQVQEQEQQVVLTIELAAPGPVVEEDGEVLQCDLGAEGHREGSRGQAAWGKEQRVGSREQGA